MRMRRQRERPDTGPMSYPGLVPSHNFQNRERNINYDYEVCQPYPWMTACPLFVTHNVLLILCQFYSETISLVLMTLFKITDWIGNDVSRCCDDSGVWPVHMAWDDGCLRLSGCKVDFHVNMLSASQQPGQTAPSLVASQHWTGPTQTNFHQLTWSPESGP